MKDESMFFITETGGFTPLIGSLVCQMNYVRYGTLSSVSELSKLQLDHLYDKKSNSIGMLLMHIAMVEKSYQMETFEGLKGEHLKILNPGLDLDETRLAIKDNPLEYYVNLLNEIRAETLSELKKRDDQWLKEESIYWDGLNANNWFKWFHVMEDEINHRGQINWLKKRLPGLGDI